MGKDTYKGGQLTDRRWGYSRAGAVIGDTLIFQEGATVNRRYEYNQRGQRTATRTGITLTSGSLGTEGSDSTIYFYNSVTARLDSMATWSGSGKIARVRWQYDRGARETERAVALGDANPSTAEVRTATTYDAVGRPTRIKSDNIGITGNTKVWYEFGNPFGSPVYDKLDDLITYAATEPGFSSPGKSYTQSYSTDGTRRLVRSETSATVSRTYLWIYDVFGNRKTETYGNTAGEGCVGSAPMDYGADNRLLMRHSFPGCPKASRYWTDQAGNRLAETDTATGVPAKAQMTYTASGQLYYTLTPTASAGTYDYNWHWYDADGMRVMTQAAIGTTMVAPRPGASAGGTVSYYVYDGDNVALVLGRAASGNTWWVRQRQLTGGVDEVLAGRYSPAGTQYQNLALIPNREGTTVASVKNTGDEELSAYYPSRNAFGNLEGASGTGSSTNTETGYTGASTPNQTGGFTYLRNRWYDPQTGRFLTQDPIGLAGGVNLYAYAGNNPVAYGDPYGLCVPPFTGICARIVVFVLGRALPFLSSVGAAMTGLSNGPGAVASNTRAGATLGRLAATFEANVDKLDDVHLGAVAREVAGEVVAWNQAAGRPFDHQTEVRSAMQGMRNVISGVDKLLSKGRPTAEQRAAAEGLKNQALEALKRAQEALAGQEKQ